MVSSAKQFLWKPSLVLAALLLTQAVLADRNSARGQSANNYWPTDNSLDKTSAAEKLKRDASRDAADQKMRNDRRERYEIELKKLEEEYSVAKVHKSEDPRDYVVVLAKLASHCANFGETDAERVAAHQKGNAYFKEALAIFGSPSFKPSQSDLCARLLWQYVGRPNGDDFEDNFKPLLRATDQKVLRNKDVDRYITEAILSQSYAARRQGGKTDIQALWKDAIDIRSSTLGKDSPSLQYFYSQYSLACVARKEFDEAEKALRKSLELNPDHSDDSVVKANLQLANFFLDAKKWDKAQLAIHDADKLTNKSSDAFIASQFVSLINSYTHLGRATDAEALVEKLLGKGGSNFVNALEPIINELVNGYLNSGELAKGADLMSKRLLASKTCLADRNANEWRLKLSKTDLALGRETESKKLFEQARVTMALQGIPTDQILAERVALLQALGKGGTAAQAAAAAVSTPALIQETTSPIRIRYQLLARQNIEFGHNTQIDSYDSATGGQTPVAALNHQDASSVASLGTITCKGNFSYKGLMAGTLTEPKRYGVDCGPLPPGAVTISPPKKIPATVVDAEGGAEVKSGDFRTNDFKKLHHGPTSAQGIGPVRIFLVDGPGVVDHIDVGEVFRNNSVRKPRDFQVWYGGRRELRLASDFHGIVYAPNATVRIEFNGRFYGAIVANRIVGEGNNFYYLDTSVSEQDL